MGRVAFLALRRRARLGEGIRGLFAARRAPALVIALSLTLASTSLGFGFSVDEYYQRVALSDSPIAGMQRASWQMFTFAAKEVNPALLEQGLLPWWTEPQLTISFFRPLSSLTLFLDHRLWGDHAVLFHVHSMVWYGLLLLVVWLVYREFQRSPKLPALALALYALDDARAQVVGWVSLRNASIALIPAFLALIAHHRHRQGQGRHYLALACLGLALGLLGGEMASAVCGYLFAYALFLERGPLRRRACSLLPYLLVLVPYRILYQLLGFGALYSGLYVDPAREPLAFVGAVVAHLPVLLFAQFALLPSELWQVYGVLHPLLQPLVYLLLLPGLAWLVTLLWPLLRGSAEARFWAVGSVLATLPTCGTFPADRLLVATSLGASALLADLLLRLFEPRLATPVTRRVGYTLVLMHCVCAPLFLTVRARDVVLTEQLLREADQSVSRGVEIETRRLIVVNPILSAFGMYFPVYRHAHGGPTPHGFRDLASAESALFIERVDARTLKLRPEGGFLASVDQQIFRRASRPFVAGQNVRLSDATFLVSEITSDGRPAEVLVRFDRDLDDPSLQWMQWGRRSYVPFVPPALGEHVLLPKVELLPMMFGDS